MKPEIPEIEEGRETAGAAAERPGRLQRPRP